MYHFLLKKHGHFKTSCVSVSDTLGTLLYIHHALIVFKLERDKIFVYLKELDFKYVFKYFDSYYSC